MRLNPARVVAVIAALTILLSARLWGAPRPGPSLERYLHIDAAYGPSVAPDGREIAFLSNLTGTFQAWRIGTGPSHPDALKPLTNYEDRLTFVRWFPDGDSLLFGKDRNGNERTQLYRCNARGSEYLPLTSDAAAIHRFGAFSDDGSLVAFASNERDPACFDVYVLRVHSGQAQRVLQDDGTWEAVCFSPDHGRLIVREVLTNLNENLYVLDLVNGERKLLTPHHGEARYDDVSWPSSSPPVSGEARSGSDAQPGRSETLWLITNQGEAFSRVARLDVQTGRLEEMGGGRWDVTDLAVSRTGRFTAWIANEDGYSRLHLGALYHGPAAAPVVDGLPDGVYGGLSFSRNERILALSCSGPRQPGEVWAMACRGGRPWQVTHSALVGIDPDSFLAPTLVHYESFDGRRIPALLYRPAGGAARHPVVISVHGGPESQERPRFSALYQYLLARGYGILAPNIRGSTGYGRAYTHLDDGRKREDAIDDVAWGARYLRSRPDVDGRRIAVMGGSYGGYVALAELAFHPEDFAAGIDIAGIANLQTFLKHTGPWRRKLRAAEYGDPVADADVLQKLSPIRHVDDITAPLLVIHGRQDPRVPLSEAEQIVKALQTRGRPVQLLVFDDEGHGVARLKNRITAYSAVVDFLDRTLGLEKR